MPEPEKINLRKSSIEKSANSNLPARPSDDHCTKQPPHYVLADLNCLTQLVDKFPCSFCGSCTLQFDVSENHGFASKISLVCDSCGVANSTSYSSARSAPNIVGKTSSRPDFDVNRRAVQAFQAIGKGYAAVEQFSLTMGMHVMSPTTFRNKCEFLHNMASVGGALSLEDVRSKVRKAYQELDPSIKDGDIIDIDVSYDGSWHTRGFSSKNGLACVIDLLTGYIIDFIVLSKFCHTCTRAKTDLGEDSPEYELWSRDHKSSCQANYEGSSPAMEVNAALRLWKRSETYKMRYTTLLSDGDAKTFNYLVTAQVYGPDVELKKEECINHVGKRLGTALRTLTKTSKAQGVTLGGKSHGSLKDVTITKLTNYYHNAIVGHANDIVAMKSAIFATLYHGMSTDEKPQHQKCPKGPTSWCFYERAVANNENPGSHMSNVHTPLSTTVVKALIPVYQRMANDNLLGRCKGRTQNANESIHSRIWAKCPKSVFASRHRIESAVIDAVCQYNNGYVKSHLDNLYVIGLSPCRLSVEYSQRKEMRRLHQCARKAGKKYGKIRRKVRLAALRAESLKKSREGTTYCAGGFDLDTTM